MKTSITWLTVRVRVHIPRHGHWPDRVRVIVKERGALFFPYRLKVMSIHLYKNKWRQVGEKRWWNEQAAAVPLRLGDLQQRAERQRLALQLYCLRGCTVQHKALGCFKRLMQQLQNDELILELHYPGCSDYYHHSIQRQDVATKTQPQTPLIRREDDRTEEASLKDVTAPSQQPSAHSIQEVQGSIEEATKTPTEKSLPSSRPIHFSGSGSVFAELLHEYDQTISQEQAALKTQTEKRVAEEAASRDAKTRRNRLLALWWMRLEGVATFVFVVHKVLPTDITGGLVSMVTVLVGAVVVYCCSWRARRPVNATRTHLQLPKERKCGRPAMQISVKRSTITRRKRHKREGAQGRASGKNMN